jgi:hypothetical protein
MQYVVKDSNGNVVESGAYPESGILLSGVAGFNEKSSGPYTVSVWAGDDDNRSLVNTQKYYYKGKTISAFDYNTTTRLFASYQQDAYTVTNSKGSVTSTISMYPNGVDAATLTYTDSYGIKVSWSSDNPFAANCKVNKIDGNGYWLIETSTLGYEDLTLNLEQLSSNKGPRDWGLAYSTDGANFTYIDSSNVRTVSNDSGDSTETYDNFSLPSACSNQAKLYIKIFINGGESVDGTELADVLKGNTGINKVELCGVEIPATYDIKVSTVALENPTDTTGSISVDGYVIVNGVEYKTQNGCALVTVTEGPVSIVASANENLTFPNTYNFVADDNTAQNLELTLPIVCVDFVADGTINVKDYAMLTRDMSDSDKQLYKPIFAQFMGEQQKSFTYAK